MNNLLVERLREIPNLDVFDDWMTRQVYSQDASIFRLRPQVVIWPRTLEHVQKILQLCHELQVSVTARGAGTSVTGAPLGEGVVLDTSRWMNHIISIDGDAKTADVEPGAVQDVLNEAASSLNLRLGPDTSTGNRATLGGMIGNNSAGAHSPIFGMMADHLLECDVILFDGTLITLKNSYTVDELERANGPLRKILNVARSYYGNEDLLNLPSLHRQASGYNLKALAATKDLNLCRAFCGSEGTLGILVRAKVKLVQQPVCRALLLLGFNSLREALEESSHLTSDHTCALEVIDEQILQSARVSPDPDLRNLAWLQNSERAFLGIEVMGNTQHEVLGSLAILESKAKLCTSRLQLITREQIDSFWLVRKSGLGLLLARHSLYKAVAFIEDLTIPPHQLLPFFDALQDILQREGCTAGIYGHAASGCLHIRPYLNLLLEKDEKKLWSISLACAKLVHKLGGSLSGGHGDGLVRAWLAPLVFSPGQLKAFAQWKEAFDPHGVLNPGKMIAKEKPDRFLKVHSGRSSIPLSPTLDFSGEGGLVEAARRCNGNGQCRKLTGGMCPSFQVTQDERHSTRGRAVALQGVFDGEFSKNTWASDELYEILDLCLECKACVRECPSSVDMTKLKAEFLYHYRSHPWKIRRWLFIHLGSACAIASKLPVLIKQSINQVVETPIGKWLLHKIGFAKSRTLPKLSLLSLDDLYQNREPRSKATVLVYGDSYTRFYEPEIALATLTLLEKLGCIPYLLPYQCCGRPAFSKGALDIAKSHVMRNLDLLGSDELPVILLEPSCQSMLSHDLLSLVATEKAKAVASRMMNLEQFLLQEKLSDQLSDRLKKLRESKLMHAHIHCHERALIGEKPLVELCEKLGIRLHLTPSTCCGMAGSFGYECEHEELSKKIGELRLIPYILETAPGSLLVASGVSCRNQIRDLGNRSAQSLAQVLLSWLIRAEKTQL